jgi:hypothetical protein
MKKFLVVLLLLVVASLAYSVGGSLYMRYYPDGTVLANEGWAPYLEDLRVGRRGTGFDLNFDAFTLSYKLRSPKALPDVLTAVYTVQATQDPNAWLNVDTKDKATSPGYVQFTGLKLGGATLGIGGTWWHFDESYSSNNVSGNIGYNVFAFDVQLDVPMGDMLRFHIDPWDKLDIVFGSGNAKNANIESSYSTYKFIIPLHLDINLEAASIELFPKFEAEGTTTKDLNGVESTSSSMKAGLMVRVNIPVGDIYSIYVHPGFVWSDTSTKIGSADAIGTTSMEAPIFAGLSIKPAGAVTLNLGAGYLLVLSEVEKPTDAKGQSVSGLIGEYGYFDEHGYKNPFLRFAGSAKFASDWELGMSTIVNFQGQNNCGGNSDKYYGGVTGTDADYAYAQILRFTYFNNWDDGGGGYGANYIQYSKDGVTIKGVFGGDTSKGIAGLFSYIECAFNF